MIRDSLYMRRTPATYALIMNERRKLHNAHVHAWMAQQMRQQAEKARKGELNLSDLF